MDTGAAAWLLTSAALVFLMTPGVALFYGGMVRAKAVLNMLMLSAAALAVTMVVWVLWGWSISYAGNDVAGIFGDPVTRTACSLRSIRPARTRAASTWHSRPRSP